MKRHDAMDSDFLIGRKGCGMENITFGLAKILRTVVAVAVGILCIVGYIIGVIVRGALVIVPVVAVWVLACYLIHWQTDWSDNQWATQCGTDYRAVTSMHLSKLKQGDVIDLSRYRVDLSSNNASVVKILANGSVWAAATGTATMLVTNEADSHIRKTISISVVDSGKS